jgi:hypothetical protein
MAQFIPIGINVEVLGQSIFSVVNAISLGKESRLEILKKNGIENLSENKWYSQEKYLKAFSEIAADIGPSTLFAIGKSVPEHAVFPPEIDSLEKALHVINVAYEMNHRGGEIGSYKLVRFDSTKRQAEMVCANPYPSEFDRGIITTILRKFKPKDSTSCNVSLDSRKPSRLKGGDSCTYLISWQTPDQKQEYRSIFIYIYI